MKKFFLKATTSAAILSLALFVSASAQDNTNATIVPASADNQLVREDNVTPVENTTTTDVDAGQVILTTYNSEEILVVVQDIFGNEIYSKIVFRNQCAVLKAYDPYDTIPSGVYTVVATSRNELFNQKIVID